MPSFGATPCPNCKGTGEAYGISCTQCGGSGYWREPPPPQTEPDPEGAKAAAEDAIEQVTENIDPDWDELAYGAIVIVASRCTLFTTDDVWFELAKQGVASPREARAMAAPMRRAHSGGLIEPTQEYRPSERIKAHHGPKRVWRSRIYLGDL